jgi:hypothetical protein
MDRRMAMGRHLDYVVSNSCGGLSHRLLLSTVNNFFKTHVEVRYKASILIKPACGAQVPGFTTVSPGWHGKSISQWAVELAKIE